MTDTSLIERLNKQLTLRTNPKVTIELGDNLELLQALEEAIAALTTPTSDEVAQESELIGDALNRIDDELHGLNYGLYSTIHDVLSGAADLLQRLDRENQRMENQLAASVHSCSPYCQRPMCVMQRKLDRVTRQRDALEEITRKAMEGLWWDGYEPWSIDRLESWLKAQVCRAMGESE